MAAIAGEGRSQPLLLPDSFDKYVGTESPVRCIDAFVDGVDLTSTRFQRVEPIARAKPSP